MSATVTVVVRTRNRPAMLTRALGSIGSQTFTDYEVVIVNDAGDEAEVRSIVKKQKSAVRSKITIVTNEVSNGREAALESGLSASHNRYYAVHDDDDLVVVEGLRSDRCEGTGEHRRAVTRAHDDGDCCAHAVFSSSV